MKKNIEKPPTKLLKPRPSSDAADAHGDFYYDELMTPQPDSMREFLRSQLLKPMKPEKKGKK
jgi:hypothetical protein